jgi:hypothetical protein
MFIDPTCQLNLLKYVNRKKQVYTRSFLIFVQRTSFKLFFSSIFNFNELNQRSAVYLSTWNFTRSGAATVKLLRYILRLLIKIISFPVKKLSKTFCSLTEKKWSTFFNAVHDFWHIEFSFEHFLKLEEFTKM